MWVWNSGNKRELVKCIMKSFKMCRKRAQHVSRMKDKINAYKMFVHKSCRRDAACRKCTWGGIFKKRGGKEWASFMWFRICTSGWPFEHGDESSSTSFIGTFLVNT